MYRRVFLVLFVLLAGVGVGSARAAASSPSDAASFVDGVVANALHTLADQTITAVERDQRTATLLRQDFDIARISHYVLGRYSEAASADDLRRFDGLFVDWLVRSYSPSLRKYAADAIKLTTARSDSGDDAVVTTAFRDPAGGPDQNIEWRVSARDGGLKIVDVDVEGVSMLVTERDQVAAIVQHSGGTVASLNGQLALKLHPGANQSSGL